MKYIIATTFFIFITTSIFSQCNGSNAMTINDSATVEKDCVHKYYATLNTISTKNGYVNCSSVRLGSSILVKQSITDSLDFGIQILSYKSLTIRGLDVISYFKNTGFYFCKEFKEEVRKLAPGNKVILYEIVAKLPDGKNIILDPVLYIME